MSHRDTVAEVGRFEALIYPSGKVWDALEGS